MTSSNNKHKLKSKYFNFHGTGKEQNLVNSLIKESIHINGIDMLYVPRKYVNLDKIYGEDVLSSFEKTFEMVFYVESSESYQGAHSFLGTMGLDIQDQSVLILSRDVFKEVLVDSEDNDAGITQPRPGDLIYNQVMDRIFEIVNVENFKQFYQLGKQYTYAITVEFFDYSNETIKTGISEIDNKNDSFISTNYEITLKTTPGSGDPVYEVDEVVYIGVNLAVADFTGTVISYNKDTRKLFVESTFGEPKEDEVIVGDDSGTLLEVDSFVPVKFSDNNKDNDQLKTEASDSTVVDPEDDDFGYGN